LQFAQDAPDSLQNHQPAFLLVSAVIAGESGELARASAVMDAALLSETPALLSWVEIKASLDLDQDRLDDLDQHLEGWVRRGREQLGPPELAFISLIQARARLSANKLREAARFLRMIPAAERQPWLSLILVSESNIARLEGRPRAALVLA